jgi:ascorbate PTS system EIIA or EIIAB component
VSILSDAFGADSIAILERVSDRIEAITKAGELLVQSECVTQDYVGSMLEALEQFGPYFVIAPQIALAHGKPSDAVLKTGLSLLLVREPVEFKHSQNDPVSLVFGLAATDHKKHLTLMAELAELLGDSSKVNSLLNAADIDQIRALLR